MSALVIMDSPDEKKQPRIEIKDEKGKTQRKYLLPSGAHLMVDDGAEVSPGDILAKIPRETAKTKDITGGLPRVVELFEARRPKEPAVITEIDGSVKYGDVAKQHRKIYVTGDDNEQREYQLPRGAHINVQEAERVQAGRAADGRPDRPARHPARARREGAAALPGRRDPGGLPAAGREHQRQAHRGDRPADDALGEDRGGRATASS
jgi:DNA-directed RNA polymerase subunit beta'